MTTRDINDLQQEYLTHINQMLPNLPNIHEYPVRYNHCWARIILDNVCDMPWYLCLKKPAYRHLSESQLEQAINLAKEMTLSPEYAHSLNQKSLTFRGKNNQCKI